MNRAIISQRRDLSGSVTGRSERLVAAGAWVRRRLAFLIVVVLPTALAVVYYGLFASPQYLSQAEFVVRGQSSQAPTMLSGLLSGGTSGATEDTYAVQDYVTSRDAARLLMRTQDLTQIYDTPRADFLARFPNLYSGHTFEHFYAYYARHVKAELDTTTGLSTLRVRTFSPGDSQRVARALLTAAEQLVNQMNARQRQNTIAASLHEREEAIDRLRAINAKVDVYRNQTAMLNPQLQSQPLLHDIAGLETMRMTTRIQLDQLRKSTPDSPLIQVLTRRMTALDRELAQSSSQVTGADGSFVPKISGYDDLAFQRQLVEREVSAADAALDAARIQADRQQLYLDQVTQPDLPDYAAYPRSLADIAIVFATMFAFYLMGALLIAGAREHKSV